jgi:hypothetical protein
VELWRERESTRDAVKGAIRDYLWNDATGLPVAYSLEEVEIRTDAVFQQVFYAYPTVPSPVYAAYLVGMDGAPHLSCRAGLWFLTRTDTEGDGGEHRRNKGIRHALGAAQHVQPLVSSSPCPSQDSTPGVCGLRQWVTVSMIGWASSAKGRRPERREQMPTVTLTEEDSRRAEAVWTEYQKTHDVSDRVGQTAGIDPETGRIWFGDSILHVADQRDAEGVHKPLHFVRVGSEAYYHKGGRR